MKNVPSTNPLQGLQPDTLCHAVRLTQAVPLDGAERREVGALPAGTLAAVVGAQGGVCGHDLGRGGQAGPQLGITR